MIINRIGQDPFHIKRGDAVCVRCNNYTVTGVSKARMKIRITSQKAVRKGGFEVDARFAYPPLPEPLPPFKLTPLSNTISFVNKKNQPSGGWNESDKVL